MDGGRLVPRVYIKKRTPCSMDSSSVISLDCVPRITTPRFSQFCRESGWVTANDNIIIIIASVTVHSKLRVGKLILNIQKVTDGQRAVGCGRNNHFTWSEQIIVRASTYLTFKMQNGWLKWHLPDALISYELIKALTRHFFVAFEE